MGTLLSLFTGPLGTIIGYLVGGIFVVATLSSLYLIIVHNAKMEQQALDQKAILEQVVKEQQDFINKSNQILIDSQTANDDLKKTVDKINEDTSKINTEITNPESVKGDRPASTILQNVIKDLGGQ
jgi:peptidoglycan hydrolase CwlO-like protein